ncbi:MAG: HAD-IIA family hydrolase [Armatimonadetes bacterium]|nr:HAD-IIA family hydrolase [Armatimonadota bacterium]
MNSYILIFDLDGVIYRGANPVPRAVEAVNRLQASRHRVYFLTNNSSQTRESYRQKLASMGIHTDIRHIMTSAYATALVMAEEDPGKWAYVVGHEGLKEEMAGLGFNLADPERGNPVDYVVVGIDREFTYKKLTYAQHAILKGARFVATNRDATFPAEETIMPGGGTMVAAIETATSVAARLIGKPETITIDLILKQEGGRPREAYMIGDRLDTDVLVGKKAGIKTVLVMTGVTTPEEMRAAPPEMRPDIVIEWLDDLERWLA